MYSYVYEDSGGSEIISLRHFFTSHPNPEWRRIIHFARILSVELLVAVLLIMVHMYFHFSVNNVEASYVAPVTDYVEAEELFTYIPPSPQSDTAAPIISATVAQSQVLGTNDVALPEQAKPLKDKYVIALYGDSMVDTMGEVCEYLGSALKKLYPKTAFLCYNYGVGSQNARDGLMRFNNRLDYQSRHYPSIAEAHPDIIVMGSFAYNVFSPHDRNEHWLDLTRLVQAAQKTGADVYMLAEIAPLRNTFGKGPHGVNWETSTVYKQSGNIIEQLENVIGLSATLNVPLIDAFTPSKVEGRDEGKKEYVNTDDGIHPSVKGHEFMAELIAKKIELK